MSNIPEKVIVPFSPPDVTAAEEKAVQDVLQSGWITTGPQVSQFERELSDYCGTDRTVVLSSATAALELTLRLLGIGAGDEVITTAYTFSATAAAIHHVGASIVLVDVAPNSFFMDLNCLNKAITPNTKAIIPVDIGGVMADYASILRIADDARSMFHPASPLQEQLGRVAIIADGAHSLGATSKGLNSGQAADFTVFSFHAVKNLTTAEGGAVTWNSTFGMLSGNIHRELTCMALHGQTKSALDKSKPGAWDYDIVLPGYKCNMTDIAAAMGRVQLQRFPNMLVRRRQLIRCYDQVCNDLNLDHLIHQGDDFASSGHLYLLLLPSHMISRDEFISRMSELGIACNVHYKPLPLLTAYKELGFNIVDFPNSFSMFSREVTLPLFSRMTDAQIEYTCAHMTRVLTS